MQKGSKRGSNRQVWSEDAGFGGFSYLFSARNILRKISKEALT